MKSFNTIVSAVLGIAMVAVFPSNARSTYAVPANAGHAYFSSQSGCFYQTSWAGMANSCTGSKSWVIPVPNGFAAGNRSFYASKTVWSGKTVPCSAFVTSENGSFVWRSGYVWVGIGTQLFGTPYAVPSDTFHFQCELEQESVGYMQLAGVRVN